MALEQKISHAILDAEQLIGLAQLSFAGLVTDIATYYKSVNSEECDSQKPIDPNPTCVSPSVWASFDLFLLRSSAKLLKESMHPVDC